MTKAPKHSPSTLDRRRLIAAAGATFGSLALGGRPARAQAKVSPPNIIKAGTLIMSVNPTLPPMQFVDQTGALKGMRVELGEAIAKRLCLTPEYVRIEFSAMIPGLQAGRWDVINTGIFYTDERAKLMQMLPYEDQAISISTARGNPLKISKPEDLSVAMAKALNDMKADGSFQKLFDQYGVKAIDGAVVVKGPAS